MPLYICFCTICYTHDAHDIFESLARYIDPNPLYPVPYLHVSLRYANHPTITRFTRHPACWFESSSMPTSSPSRGLVLSTQGMPPCPCGQSFGLLCAVPTFRVSCLCSESHSQDDSMVAKLRRGLNNLNIPHKVKDCNRTVAQRTRRVRQ